MRFKTKTKTKRPIIQHFSPAVSILEIFQMATYYLRMYQERSRKGHTLLQITQLIPAQIHWVSHLLCLKFLCLGWPASLLHLSNETASHVRYFTALTWQGHGGREATQSRNKKNKISQGLNYWIQLYRTAPHFWVQTSSQPQNPQKELKLKEVRAAEIKQNSQLQGNMWNHIVSFCNFVCSLEFQWCQWWSVLVMVQRCIEEPIFKNWPVNKLQNYCQSQ